MSDSELVAVAEIVIALAVTEMQQFQEDMEFMQMQFDEEARSYIPRNRRYWVRPSQTDAIWQSFRQNLVVANEWMEMFRMPRNTFYKLADSLRPVLAKEDTRFRYAITVEKRIGITLHYLHDEGRLRTTAKTFGVGKSTVSTIVREVCWAIKNTLGPKYIKVPKTNEEMKTLVNGYLNHHGMPQTWASTDGTHIFTKQPSLRPQDYLNRKGRYSINVMATADYKYRFVDVCVAFPGSMHDASVFVRSQLYQKLLDGEIPSCKKVIVPGRPEVPACLLGDAAYPLSLFLLKEYPNQGKYLDEQYFSQMLSSARMVIECAFGRLKGKWKCLQRDMDINMADLPAVIYSCFVLHNFVIENKPANFHQPDEMSDEDCIDLERRQQPETLGHRGNDPVDASDMRDIFKDYFQ